MTAVRFGNDDRRSSICTLPH